MWLPLRIGYNDWAIMESNLVLVYPHLNWELFSFMRLYESDKIAPIVVARHEFLDLESHVIEVIGCEKGEVLLEFVSDSFSMSPMIDVSSEVVFAEISSVAWMSYAFDWKWFISNLEGIRKISSENYFCQILLECLNKRENGS